MPDFPFLYDKLTPWEFIRFTGQLFQMSEERIAAGARELVARFNLELPPPNRSRPSRMGPGSGS